MKTDAVVFMLFGQSNAVGHILPMRQEDKILTPMKNVFGLSRTLNQSFDNDRLYWTGYTSFDMNLAETQDDTYSVANVLARMWQDRIDAGQQLPDLHIVHIAIGAEGVTDKYMWYPDREKKLRPGQLGTVDISMYPLSLHILSLLDDSFARLGKTWQIMSMHWIGGAEDVTEPVEKLNAQLDDIYMRMFQQMRETAGKRLPVVLHKLAAPDREMDMDPSGNGLKRMYFINGEFDYLSRVCEDVTVFDITTAPHYIPNVRGNGLYLDVDVVHHTEQTNRWIAQWILEDYLRTNALEEM